MVHEIFRYRIEPERADAFLRACRVAEASLRESEHCLSYELSRCAKAPEDFILMIGWDSLGRSLEAFRASHEFEPFVQSVRPFSADILEEGCYERVPLARAGANA